ncbi:MAG: hypothetical protein AB1609_07240 [Bacillota bacterium]
MTRRVLFRCAALLGHVGLITALAGGAVAASGPQTGSNRPGEPRGIFSAIRVDPESCWQLRWQLTHSVEQQGLLLDLPGFRRDTVTMAFEIGRRFTWEAGGVTWKATASLRAGAMRQYEAEDGAAAPLAPPAWETSVGLPGFGLAALGRDPASGRAVEVAAEWFLDGERPGQEPAPGQVVGVTVSRVMDPAVVAASVAVGARAGPRPSAVLSAAGEWRLVMVDGLAVYAGAGLGVSIPLGQVSGRAWAGVALNCPSGAEVALALQRPLDREAEYGWQVDLQVPQSGG